MPIVDLSTLRVTERLPGWHGRYFHSKSMTFAHYEFKRGSSIYDHSHPQEEVYEVLEGELEVTIDGVAKIIRPGLVAIIPAGARHSVKAVTDGRAIMKNFAHRGLELPVASLTLSNLVLLDNVARTHSPHGPKLLPDPPVPPPPPAFGSWSAYELIDDN